MNLVAVNEQQIPSRTLELLTPREAAKQLGVSPGTLAKWRCNKTYPLKFTRIGYRIRYRLSDLISFVESRLVGAAPEPSVQRRKR